MKMGLISWSWTTKGPSSLLEESLSLHPYWLEVTGPCSEKCLRRQVLAAWPGLGQSSHLCPITHGHLFLGTREL